MTGPVLVPAPVDGVWRVARGPEPFALRDAPPPLFPPEMLDRATGNRFDSALGDYRVWYLVQDEALLRVAALYGLNVY